jgi:hypothetical protein
VGSAIEQGKPERLQVAVGMGFVGNRKISEFIFHMTLVGTLGHKIPTFAQYGTHLPLTAT